MQQIIDYLYYYNFAAGKHLMFFYLVISCFIGLPSLVVLLLVSLKIQWKTLTYMFYFLLAKTGELSLITFIMYQQANHPSGFRIYENVLFFCLESLSILLLPLLVNELFLIAQRRQINYVFTFLFGIGLVLIIAPCLLGVYGRRAIPVYLQEGISFESLNSFQIYRLLFMGAYLYTFLVVIFKLKTMNNLEERKFVIRLMVILLVLVYQPLISLIKTFPENTFIFATGYFFLTILFLKYVSNRFFEDFNLLPSCSLVGINIDTIELTDREKEVVLLLEQGLTSKNIGARLFISEATVKTHLKNIYQKFEVNSRTQLLYKLRNGHIHDP